MKPQGSQLPGVSQRVDSLHCGVTNFVWYRPAKINGHCSPKKNTAAIPLPHMWRFGREDDSARLDSLPVRPSVSVWPEKVRMAHTAECSNPPFNQVLSKSYCTPAPCF